MSGAKFGVLAEDPTDREVLSVLIRRIVPGAPPGVTTRGGGGCSKLKRKAKAWLAELASAGCTALIVVHDLDRDPDSNTLRNEAKLRSELSAIESPQGIPRLVCIPVEEIEAWFWADPKVIEKVGQGRGKDEESPHQIVRPKEKLQKISQDAGRKPRYSTNDNPILAKVLNLELCAVRCPAFASLQSFVREHGDRTPTDVLRLSSRRRDRR